MKKLRFEVKGVQPLMLNNPQNVNPFNKFAIALKPLNAKRKKTEEDYYEMYRLQFESSLYIKGDSYIIPCDHFWRAVCTAAREQKLGKKFEQSFQIIEDCLLEFPEKDMTPNELYKEGSHVDIRDTVIQGRSRLPSCRAIFSDWSTNVECWYDETQLDEKDIVQMFNIAGQRYGVGTYRKRYGRFEAKKVR